MIRRTNASAVFHMNVQGCNDVFVCDHLALERLYVLDIPDGDGSGVNKCSLRYMLHTVIQI